LEFHKRMGWKEVGQQETKGGAIRVALITFDLV
jgi:predicted GNAT superfamily acetyltransferase